MKYIVQKNILFLQSVQVIKTICDFKGDIEQSMRQSFWTKRDVNKEISNIVYYDADDCKTRLTRLTRLKKAQKRACNTSMMFRMDVIFLKKIK